MAKSDIRSIVIHEDNQATIIIKFQDLINACIVIYHGLNSKNKSGLLREADGVMIFNNDFELYRYNIQNEQYFFSIIPFKEFQFLFLIF